MEPSEPTLEEIITERFTYHAPNDRQRVMFGEVHTMILDLALYVGTQLMPGPEQEQALTALEDVRMKINKAIVFDPVAQDRLMAAMGGAIYSMAADDYIRWRIRLECERVGCTEPTTVVWAMWEEHIVHGGERYYINQGRYETAWIGIVGWLDSLHAPLVEAKATSDYPDASMT